jgi:hypothetical protein
VSIATIHALCAAAALMAAGCAAFGGNGGGSACDVLTQSGCARGEKCTLDIWSSDTAASATPACAANGSAAPYAPCGADADCSGGTFCTLPPTIGAMQNTTNQGSFECLPFCNTATGAPCGARVVCTPIIGPPGLGLCGDP